MFLEERAPKVDSHKGKYHSHEHTTQTNGSRNTRTEEHETHSSQTTLNGPPPPETSRRDVRLGAISVPYRAHLEHRRGARHGSRGAHRLHVAHHGRRAGIRDARGQRHVGHGAWAGAGARRRHGLLHGPARAPQQQRQDKRHGDQQQGEQRQQRRVALRVGHQVRQHVGVGVGVVDRDGGVGNVRRGAGDHTDGDGDHAQRRVQRTCGHGGVDDVQRNAGLRRGASQNGEVHDDGGALPVRDQNGLRGDPRGQLNGRLQLRLGHRRAIPCQSRRNDGVGLSGQRASHRQRDGAGGLVGRAGQEAGVLTHRGKPRGKRAAGHREVHPSEARASRARPQKVEGLRHERGRNETAGEHRLEEGGRVHGQAADLPRDRHPGGQQVLQGQPAQGADPHPGVAQVVAGHHGGGGGAQPGAGAHEDQGGAVEVNPNHPRVAGRGGGPAHGGEVARSDPGDLRLEPRPRGVLRRRRRRGLRHGDRRRGHRGGLLAHTAAAAAAAVHQIIGHVGQNCHSQEDLR
eukprot:RCo000888